MNHVLPPAGHLQPIGAFVKRLFLTTLFFNLTKLNLICFQYNLCALFLKKFSFAATIKDF